MALSAREVLLQHVCPGLGCLVALFMFLSPLRAVLRAQRDKSLGALNALPFAMMAVTCAAWMFYARIVIDFYIFTGLMLGLYYTLTCYKYSKEAAQDALRVLLLAFSTLFFVAAFADMAARLSPATARTLWGATCVGVLSLYYAAPLSSVGRVLSTRDSSSLHAPLCAMNAINGALWFAYGLAVKDYFVAVPNGVGASFNAACVVLCVIFPPRERKDSGNSGDAEDISSGSAGGAAAAGVEWKLLRLQSITGGRGMRARSGFFDLSQLRWRQGGAGSMLMRMMSSSRSLRSLTSQRGAAAAAAACAPATDAAAPPEAAAAAAKGAADTSDSLASSSVETADCRVRGLETSGDVAGTGTAAAKGTAVDLEAPRADGSGGNDGSGGVGH